MEIDYKQFEQDLISAGESPERTNLEITNLAINHLIKNKIMFGCVTNSSYGMYWMNGSDRSTMFQLNFTNKLPYNMACYRILNFDGSDTRMTIDLSKEYLNDSEKMDAYNEAILSIFNKHCKINA